MNRYLLKKIASVPAFEYLRKFYRFIYFLLWLRPSAPFGVHLTKEIEIPLKIGIGLLVNNPPLQIENSLSSILQTKLDGHRVTVVVFCDCAQDEIVLPSNPVNSSVKVLRFSQYKHAEDYSDIFSMGITKLLEVDRFDLIGLFDENVIFHPDWLLNITQTSLWAIQHHKQHTIGAFSPMNFSDYVVCQEFGAYSPPKSGEYIIRELNSLFHKFYIASDLQKLGFVFGGGSDATILSRCIDFEVRGLHTTVSYIDYNRTPTTPVETCPAVIKELLYTKHLISNGWGPEIQYSDSLGYYRYVRKNTSFGNNVYSDAPLDILMPVLEKDLDTLPLAIEGIRKYLRHPLGEIIVIAPDSPKIVAACKRLNCRFMSEDGILPIRKRDIEYFPQGLDRSGWLYKQFINLFGDQIASREYFLVLDADTVYVSPQVFIVGEKMVMLHSDEHHQPYFDAYRDLFGADAPTHLSVTSHQMLFKRELLGKFRTEMEQLHEKGWIDAIYSVLDKNIISAFSEYETYGQWTLANYTNQVVREYWFNKSLPRSRLGDTHWLRNEELTRSVSFHAYF